MLESFVAGTDILTIGILLTAFCAVTLALQSIAIRYGTIDARSSDALYVVLVINLVTFVPLAVVLGDSVTEMESTTLIAFFAAGIVGVIFGRAIHFNVSAESVRVVQTQ